MSQSLTDQIEHLIRHPEDGGFEWKFGPLHRGRQRDVVVHSAAPYRFVTNLDKAIATFGLAAVLDGINGTSWKVDDQTLRDVIHDGTISRDDVEGMQRWILAKALGAARMPRRAATVIVEKVSKIYVANDGTEFTELAECMAHNVDLMLEKSE